MNLMLVITFLLAVIGKTGFMLDEESKSIIYIEDEEVKPKAKSDENNESSDNLDEFVNAKPTKEPEASPKPPTPPPSFDSKDKPITNPFDDLADVNDLADEMLDNIFKNSQSK